MIIPNSAPRPPLAPPLPPAAPPVSRTVVFPLLPGTCVPMRETVTAGLQVRGIYEVVGVGPHVDVMVTNPAGAMIYSKCNISTGSFGFTTEQDGTYEATFSCSAQRGRPLPPGVTQEVTFTVEVRYPGLEPHTNGASD